MDFRNKYQWLSTFLTKWKDVILQRRNLLSNLLKDILIILNVLLSVRISF